jgi:predicted N-acyltransferase
MYQYLLISSAEELNHTRWQAFCETHCQHDFMRPGFLHSIEKSMSYCSSLKYALYTNDKNEIVACSVFSIFDMDWHIPKSKIMTFLIKKIRVVFPLFLKLRLLLLGPPISIGKNLLVISEGTDQEYLANAINNTMDTLSQIHKAKIHLVTESNSQQLPYTDGLTAWGFERCDSKRYYYFPPIFDDFGHYCRSLQAKYRGNINRARNNFTNKGFSIHHVTEADKITEIFQDENLYSLYLNVLQNSDSQFEKLSHDFFTHLTEQYPGEVLLTIAKKDDVNAGFVFSYYSQTNFHFLYVGLDYKLNQEANIYYNLIYATLDWALQHKQFDTIQLGQTADTFKTRLGCIGIPLYLYFKASSPRLNWLLDILKENTNYSDLILFHKVFKNEARITDFSIKKL